MMYRSAEFSSVTGYVLSITTGQVRLASNQRPVPSPLHDGILLEQVPITNYCEAHLLDKPAPDTAEFAAPVSARGRTVETTLMGGTCCTHCSQGA